jgi:predicted ribosomally synthesized peptide with SipW-like signal peptide
MKKWLFILMAVVLSVGLVGGAFAYYTDTETSSGNTFGAGTMDLTLDYRIGTEGGFTDIPNGSDVAMLTIDDAAPGDSGEITISMHNIGNVDADYLAVQFTNLVEYENGINEPEEEAGDPTGGDPGEGNGELGDYLTVSVWIDDGDNVLDGLESYLVEDVSLASVDGETLFIGSLNADETKYLGIEWKVSTAATSIIQTDSIVCDAQFTLDQVD